MSTTYAEALGIEGEVESRPFVVTFRHPDTKEKAVAVALAENANDAMSRVWKEIGMSTSIVARPYPGSLEDARGNDDGDTIFLD